MDSIRSNNLSLKYQRFTPSGCTNIGIRKLSLWQNSFFLTKKCDFLTSLMTLKVKNLSKMSAKHQSHVAFFCSRYVLFYFCLIFLSIYFYNTFSN